MKKKVTIKDIARESGVSVATVSYVLNDRKDQKISETTRNKVLQIVNLYNYKGNASARNLARGKTFNIALYTGEASSRIGALDEFAFVKALTTRIARDGYDLVYHGNGPVESLTNVDGIIFHGTTNEFFREASPINLAPIVLVDMVVGDPLFYEINNSISKVGEEAIKAFDYQSFKLLLPQGINAQLRSRLRRTYHCIDIETSEELQTYLLNNPTERLVAYGKEFGKLAQLFKKDVLIFDHLTSDKVEAVWHSLKRAMDREEILHNEVNI
ncbi:MAG TPA: LacI family DNA-binding transcriptional regulator [Bacilli bacterium]|nr:LacI family DNA-binding transcriptional regulator [Bacilli bacterium]MDD3389262.1 LacI family DNA-binding transcriptional regulator [Bacilli bacterium]MDD4344941.1 LacI family DNA-binding transcriptional regulator [Bacilli bacterium]MDD4520750.1 LacI family DNA-binding transcriptional regulator [Bacilli bacterium]HKM11118.1 LacI family DNA-binding transcriptional regulator [Bacilli bacterium]